MKNFTSLFCTLITLMLVSSSMVAQIPDFTWGKSMGGSSYDYCYDIHVDADGNSYATGKFKSSPMDVGNGIQISTVGNYDVYVVKYDPNGTPLWAVQAGSAGTSSPDEGRAVAVDASGNVLVTGAFFGTAVFGTDTLYGAGNFDVFFAKYDASGNFLWVKQGAGLNQNKGTEVKVDNDGNYILAGYFAGTSTDTMNFNGTLLTSSGNRDMYVIKTNADGDVIWATTAGGPESGDEPWGLDIDASNNIYISGFFKDVATFGTTQLTSEDGGYDAFTAKLDPNGAFQWVKGMHGPSSDKLYSIYYNEPNDEVYVTGYFEDTVTVNTQELYSNGKDDIIIAVYKGSDGSLLGVGGFGSTLDDQGKGIASLPNGEFYVAGYIDADLVVGTDTLFTSGDKDFLLLHMYQDSLISMKNYGGAKDEEAHDVVVTAGGDVILGGYFKSDVFVYDDDTLATQGNYDVFMGKITNPVVPVELTSFSANVVEDAVVLNWSTATETNNSGFEVEKSTNNIDFTKIAFVEGNGTTVKSKSYSYTDAAQGSKVYYRLKQIDYDGTYSYSNIVEVDLTVPQNFEVSQNYPNPFNPTTTVNFALPFDARVQISLFNVLGQEVASVVNADYAAGRFTVKFDGSNLSSGIYFYQIKADAVTGAKFLETKKMMLMK